MRTYWCMVLGCIAVCGSGLALGWAQEDAAKKELQRLQGTWKIQSAEQLGKKVGLAELGIDQIVIKDDRMTLRANGKDVAQYPITVDPAQKPKAMDWLNEKAKSSLPNIYALEGKELKLCFPMLKTVPIKRPDRPDSFETKDKPWGLIVAERGE
jgi:uncharacterized protein (TIGR03067 family)